MLSPSGDKPLDVDVFPSLCSPPSSRLSRSPRSPRGEEEDFGQFLRRVQSSSSIGSYFSERDDDDERDDDGLDDVASTAESYARRNSTDLVSNFSFRFKAVEHKLDGLIDGTTSSELHKLRDELAKCRLLFQYESADRKAAESTLVSVGSDASVLQDKVRETSLELTRVMADKDLLTEQVLRSRGSLDQSLGQVREFSKRVESLEGLSRRQLDQIEMRDREISALMKSFPKVKEKNLFVIVAIAKLEKRSLLEECKSREAVLVTARAERRSLEEQVKLLRQQCSERQALTSPRGGSRGATTQVQRS